MKLILICFILLSPVVSMAQSTPEIEKAMYQVRSEGETAYYTDLRCPSGAFERDDWESFKVMVMDKEGVFDVQILKEGLIIRVAHLSFVEPEVMKYFGSTVCDAISVEERQPYKFE
jgi:hypothetical protein